MARLTDRQKKKIIADYIQLESYNAAAKINGVSPNTVKNLVTGNADIAQKCELKKNRTPPTFSTIWSGRVMMFARCLGYISEN